MYCSSMHCSRKLRNATVLDCVECFFEVTGCDPERLEPISGSLSDVVCTRLTMCLLKKLYQDGDRTDGLVVRC